MIVVPHPYILQSSELIFQPYKNEGFSGELLLATHRFTNKQYVIKHQFPELACNEFMYYTIGTMLGDNIPETQLINITPNDNNMFDTKYTVAIRYLQDAVTPKLNIILNSPALIRQWIISNAISWMLSEDDTLDFLLTKENQLYRIDTASTFELSRFAVLGLQSSDPSRRAFGLDMLSTNLGNWKRQPIERCKSTIDILSKSINQDCTETFQQPLKRLLDIDLELFYPALDALAEIYPEEMCSFYLGYIEILKEKIAAYFNAP